MKGPVTLLLAAGLLACSDVLAPNTGPLAVSVTLTKPEIVRGTPVDVIVVARNVSSTVQRVQSFCVRDFIVRDVHGVDIQLPGFVCVAAIIQVAVAPGDSVVLRDHWDGATATADGREVFAAPGDYLLSGRILASATVGELSVVTSRPVRVRLK